MPTISPTLNLPQPTLSSAASTKAATPATLPTAVPDTPVATPKAPEPSSTVTLSPQALSAMAAASHASPAPSGGASSTPPAPVAVAHDGSVYEAVKQGITTAVTDVGDAIADGAHAVVEGVETTLSTAHDVAKGIVAFPFAALSKASDAAGALIDKL